jgi:GLPGLI family protein
MKTLRTNLLFLMLLVFGNVYSQNTKHSVYSAKVTYKVTAISDKTVAEKPIEFILFMKKDMSRLEMQSEEGKTVMISDNLANIGYILMNTTDQKMAMKMDRSTTMKQNDVDPEPKVVLTRESKIIAGYTCYKAIITAKTKEGENVYNVWFTNDIKGNYSYDTKIKGINGLMMEFDSVKDGKTYKMVATKVELDDNLSDELFKVPSDYQIMDMSNFMGGMKK